MTIERRTLPPEAAAGDHARMQTAISSRRRPVELICELESALSPAVAVSRSRAALAAAGAGGAETLRLFRVTSCVAFGPKDEHEPGYARALEVTGEAGFEAVARVEGGRAIAANGATLAIAWTIPGADGRARIRPRFSLLAALLAEALRALGVDARTGTVRGEYCPGDFSVNARDVVKLAGLGQRVTVEATHLGAFIVVDGASELRAVLTGVYQALRLDWEPASLGSLAGELGHPVGIEDVGRSVIEVCARHMELAPIAARGAP